MCKREFRTRQSLGGHRASQKGCNERARERREYVRNDGKKRRRKRGREEARSDQRRHICSWCNKEFPTRQALGGHRTGHKGQKGCSEKAKEATEND
ncbi:hypothetical protein BHE74_00037514 [Ensete ventricosum]|uniref:Uncharacterized protein n=1 Tax=Ensete ventricosum TaxID=4639 RepID=A0A426XNA0_ENSVE|nr:hypothetical protein B296_00046304 [Ensete ventricosum]RWV98729.1 hypothetical protein GW17_00038405 [Ensete ventricosum]RWW55823.1 hypothetical protein BHE74_00037514 [Ensete ventricosum]RZS23881.1 hypothetical protein BHM03_00056889 [Ensete ventricosum]